mgnify:CR=1 FL=1
MVGQQGLEFFGALAQLVQGLGGHGLEERHVPHGLRHAVAAHALVLVDAGEDFEVHGALVLALAAVASLSGCAVYPAYGPGVYAAPVVVAPYGGYYGYRGGYRYR